ncbi:unnamed protein product, partial [Amoebophrya sp. A120]|eukprot:GSA120T00017880001.1
MSNGLIGDRTSTRSRNKNLEPGDFWGMSQFGFASKSGARAAGNKSWLLSRSAPVLNRAGGNDGRAVTSARTAEQGVDVLQGDYDTNKLDYLYADPSPNLVVLAAVVRKVCRAASVEGLLLSSEVETREEQQVLEFCTIIRETWTKHARVLGGTPGSLVLLKAWLGDDDEDSGLQDAEFHLQPEHDEQSKKAELPPASGFHPPARHQPALLRSNGLGLFAPGGPRRSYSD